MPYELRGDCVHKVGDDRPLKCYNNHEDALAYLRALEANVEDATKQLKEMMMLSQAETNYNAAGGQVNKACSNCRWFCPAGDMEEAHCHLVAEEPAPIVSNGLCDRWEAMPTPAADPVEALAEVVTEMADSMMMVEMDLGKELEKPGVLERIAKALMPYFGRATQDDEFKVFKGRDGKWYWHAIFTNNYEDLEAEILSEKAHEEYVMRVDMGIVPPPELWGWHEEFTKHGDTDVIWYNDHFMHAIGHFDDTPIAQKAIQYYRKNKVKLSHGFTSPEWAFKNGVYESYNTFEISTLPPKAAANPFTSFEEIKAMAMTSEKRHQLKEQFGFTDAQLDEYDAKDGERSKALEELKVAYKDYAATSEAAKPVENAGYAQAYLDLSQGQSEIINLMQLQTKALQDRDNKIGSLEKLLTDQQKQLDELRTTLNQPPRRASQDESTLDTKLKDALPGDDKAAKFWGVPLKAGS